MTPIRQHMAQQLVGQTLHFKCECILGIDVTGKVVDYELTKDETIFIVSSNGKLIKIGSNHPNMEVEPV